MANSTTQKPKKPHPDFPLFPHATGRWAKKIKGRFHYFGRVGDDPRGEAALAKWLNEKDELLAGRTPRTKAGELTVRDLVNEFLNAKRQQVESGEIVPRVAEGYRNTAARVIRVFGAATAVCQLEPRDFDRLRADMAKTIKKLTSLKTEIQRTKAIFNYGSDPDLELLEKPVRIGKAFAVSEKAIRRERGLNGLKLFEPAEIHTLLGRASAPMRAMILLAVNCGFGNYDLSTLRRSEVDVEKGWVSHPRPKTGAFRRCPLWPETVAALRAVYATRPAPSDPADDDLVFITEAGRPYVRLEKAGWTDSVGGVFYRLLKRMGLARPGRRFYAFRHTFETVAGESLDQVAVDFIMGHLRGDMASVYRERIGEDRLRKVAEHVRTWLFLALT